MVMVLVLVIINHAQFEARVTAIIMVITEAIVITVVIMVMVNVMVKDEIRPVNFYCSQSLAKLLYMALEWELAIKRLSFDCVADVHRAYLLKV